MFFKGFLSLAIATGMLSTAFAGNEQRAGQAGASELLINPWARSSGMAGANGASVRGLEAMNLNVAGIAFTKKTELIFARTNWLKGTDIGINAFGFTQRIGESSVLGLGVMSMDFGDIPITTVDLPEGGIGTFSPKYNNINLCYAKEFSNSIYGGINVKAISEGIADVKASGVALDAGIQYVTGKKKNVKFGIALRNVGPPMSFSGNGLVVKANLLSDGKPLSLSQRSARFDLPSMVNISGGYDFLIMRDSVNVNHRVTVAGNFTSNSFQKDQFMLGLEYGFRTYFMVRAGYAYEKGITKKEERTTALTGPTAGFTLELPLNKKGTTFGIDYSYRFTDPFEGCHTLGARISL
jgi:hypothetical protein